MFNFTGLFILVILIAVLLENLFQVEQATGQAAAK
jgi:hypothetical protein